jgi:hypothetical protein
VEGWEEIPEVEIQREYPQVYDHWDPGERNEVDIIGYPQEDDLGREVRLYDQNGYKIPRRYALVDENQPPCGILLDLRTIETLFTTGGDDDLYSHGDNNDIDSNAVRVQLFPVAFLHKYGHVQANGVMPAFRRTMREVNDTIGSSSHRESDSDSGEDGEYIPDSVAVHPVSSQAYNELSHRIAARAGSHEVQHGRLTAALAGAYATTPKTRTIAQKIQAECNNLLPFDRFQHKIDVENCPRAIRVEQVFYVELSAMRSSMRNGA